MKRKIILFNIIVICVSVIVGETNSRCGQDEDDFSIHESNPSVKNIMKAMHYLHQSYLYSIDGKTVKSNNFKKLAMPLLKNEFKGGRIIKSSEWGPFKHRINYVSGVHYFVLSKIPDSHVGLNFHFDNKDGLFIHNKREFTSNSAFEKIEDLENDEDVNLELVIVRGKWTTEPFWSYHDIMSKVTVTCKILRVEKIENTSKNERIKNEEDEIN